MSIGAIPLLWLDENTDSLTLITLLLFVELVEGEYKETAPPLLEIKLLLMMLMSDVIPRE